MHLLRNKKKSRRTRIYNYIQTYIHCKLIESLSKEHYVETERGKVSIVQVMFIGQNSIITNRI